MAAEPLFLTSTMHEKIWGGDRLTKLFNYDIPSNHTGEYWAISAHPNGPSVIANGPYKGQSLDQLYQKQPALFGHPDSTVFPLLTKILDANDWLSVQVHPDDAYGLKHEGELGKTECWYILHAEQGAEIIYGHEAKSQTELESLITTGQWDKLLTHVPVQTGDFFFVPSGTLHAIGPGIVILETQQSSDTTYRVYDFDRKDDQGNLRPLHIQQSLDVLSIGQPENSTPSVVTLDNVTLTTLVANPFFTVEKWDISGMVSVKQTAPYLLVSVINGNGQLKVGQQTHPITMGDHFILPNDIKEWDFDGSMTLITSHI
ncbi:mannose-6-phosphate isomerase, class I [Streptococcus moroccensis]|uniref:Mannose-6-phosphate isomerase n=1 Tax=Streptococcus moroccensis TaxID=1451356 RepID=A0ABT9YTU3_9STRE|nr:mannose-6-phosphate isomerase, class I [Streptococcus moroccensis]MDQ0223170.1 mannose-6-phosphate isomerase [Streptococcus moroccensis]